MAVSLRFDRTSAQMVSGHGGSPFWAVPFRPAGYTGSKPFWLEFKPGELVIADGDGRPLFGVQGHHTYPHDYAKALFATHKAWMSVMVSKETKRAMRRGNPHTHARGGVPEQARFVVQVPKPPYGWMDNHDWAYEESDALAKAQAYSANARFRKATVLRRSGAIVARFEGGQRVSFLRRNPQSGYPSDRPRGYMLLATGPGPDMNKVVTILEQKGMPVYFGKSGVLSMVYVRRRDHDAAIDAMAASGFIPGSR